MATKKIGLIATASTTYMEPFNLARQFASLDHVSEGRVGWNIVTTWSVPAAQNFGDLNQISHSDRYTRAEEYLTVTKALWDSWSDDSIVDDRAAGLYARTESIRPVDHSGEYYSVAGPLNVPRCPQGRPVLVQAGSSDTGRDFAARHAEAVFTAHLEMTTAIDFYKDLKSRAKALDRDPGSMIILPGFSPIIGSTEAEAKQAAQELNELADVEVGRKRLIGRFGGYDFSHLPLDRPLTPDDFPDPVTVEAARSRAEVIVDMVAREKPTLRQLLAKLAGARGHFTFAGTPEQVAHELEAWFKAGAADGFNLMPPVIPWMLDVFVEEVVPLLQRRGLFRDGYNGTMLRDHYGLNRPQIGS
jgi:FMN-dependent oxidoreductase (nitrilotriacetate monooxygenase family)